MQSFSVGRICYAGRYAYQPAEESLMSEKPRHPLKEQMVNWKVLVYSYGYFGWLQMITCWAAFWVSPAADLIGVPHNEWTAADRRDGRSGMAAYYATLVAGQLAAALATTTRIRTHPLPLSADDATTAAPAAPCRRRWLLFNMELTFKPTAAPTVPTHISNQGRGGA